METFQQLSTTFTPNLPNYVYLRFTFPTFPNTLDGIKRVNQRVQS